MSDLYKISGKVVKTDDVTLTANAQGALETVRATNNEAIAGTDTNKALTPASGKALVDDVINTRLTNVVVYRGEWAITTSTTDYSGLNSYRPIKAGDYFRVTGTGPATIDGVEYNPNDSIIFNQACSATTTITTAMIDHQDHTDASDTVYETATQTLTNKTIDADDNTISDLETDNFKSGVVVTTLGPSSGSGAATNTEIPTALAVRTAINSSPIILPPGMVIVWAGTTVPEGYLLCDGSAVSRTTYSALFSAIGTTYGQGDSSSTFNLPDFQDRVIQGSGTRGNVGTYKAESLPNITGRTSSIITSTSTVEANGALYDKDGTITGTSAASGGIWAGIRWYFDASRSSPTYQTDSPVQQNALLIQCCIKY